MTNAEQRQHWLQFHRFQRRYENIYTTKFNAALKEQIKAFTETGTLMAVEFSPIYNVLQNLYFTIPSIWAARATREARSLKERMPMGFSQRIIDLMKIYYGIDLLNLADDLTQTTKDVIQRVLSEAAEEGFGFDEVVRRLQIPELTSRRARLIARTETVGAANAASNIAAKETGLLMDKIWISARDNRTRPHHRQVNQSIVPMNDTFTVGSAQMQFPGDKAGGAEECCNCFLPDQLTAINPEIIKKAFRSFYDGKVITVKGANGNSFTCTPNHPILTTKGFVAAGKLTKFDKLVYSKFINERTSGKFNINNGKSSFEQIYNSLAKGFMTMRVTGIDVDFYGDGTNSYIDIISTEGQLYNRVKNNQFISNELLQSTHFAQAGLLTDSSLGKSFNSLLFTGIMHGDISTLNESLPIFERSLSHPHKHTFTSVSNTNTIPSQSVANNIPSTTEIRGNEFNGLTGIEKIDTFWNVNNCGSITALSHSSYEGFVYTFETLHTIYDINSFIAKNCRCTHAFIPRRDSNGRLVRI